MSRINWRKDKANSTVLCGVFITKVILIIFICLSLKCKFACLCVCVFLCACVYVRFYVRVWLCTFLCTCVYVRFYVRVCSCTFLCACVFMYGFYVRVCIRVATISRLNRSQYYFISWSIIRLKRLKRLVNYCVMNCKTKAQKIYRYRTF